MEFQISESVVSAIITGLITGFISYGLSRFELSRKINRLEKRVGKLETKMEPFWQGVKNGISKALKGNPHSSESHKERVKYLLDKCETRTLTLEEAKELKSMAEKCYEKAKEKCDYSQMTYLILLMGTLDVIIERLEKKVEESKST